MELSSTCYTVLDVCVQTLVTSAALTGKTKALKTDCGDRYQVELLSAAKAYTPADNADIDVAELVQSQLVRRLCEDLMIIVMTCEIFRT